MLRKALIDAHSALHHIIAKGIERWSRFEDSANSEDFLARIG